MTDIPGRNPTDPMGKRQYEIQVLTPNLHRPGERWRALGKPYDELAKAEYAVEDIVGSLSPVIGRVKALEWVSARVRVMEMITMVEYGREIEIALRLGS